VDVAILIPDYGHALDWLMSRYAHLSLGPNVFCGTIFLHQHASPAECRANVRICKMNARMQNTNEACPLLDAYAAPARGTLEPEELLLLPYSADSTVSRPHLGDGPFGTLCMCQQHVGTNMQSTRTLHTLGTQHV
jgi:hypothetical protein